MEKKGKWEKYKIQDKQELYDKYKKLKKLEKVKKHSGSRCYFPGGGNLDLASVSNNETQSLKIFEKIKNVLIIAYM